MAIITQCTSCGARAQVPDSAVGRTVKCPQCNGLFTVGTASYAPPPPAPARRPAPPPPEQAELEFEPAPRSRRQSAGPKSGGGVVGCLGFIMGGLALIVALAALGLTWFRDPLGSGLKKYNFSTPKD